MFGCGEIVSLPPAAEASDPAGASRPTPAASADQDNQQTRSPGCPYPQDPLSSLQNHTEYRFTTYHTQYGFEHKSRGGPGRLRSRRESRRPPALSAHPGTRRREARSHLRRGGCALRGERHRRCPGRGRDRRGRRQLGDLLPLLPPQGGRADRARRAPFPRPGEGGGRARAARRAAAGSDGHRARLRGPTSSRGRFPRPAQRRRCSRSSRIRRASRRWSTTDIPSRWSGSRPSCSPRPSTAAR